MTQKWKGKRVRTLLALTDFFNIYYGKSSHEWILWNFSLLLLRDKSRTAAVKMPYLGAQRRSKHSIHHHITWCAFDAHRIPMTFWWCVDRRPSMPIVSSMHAMHGIQTKAKLCLISKCQLGLCMVSVIVNHFEVCLASTLSMTLWRRCHFIEHND